MTATPSAPPTWRVVSFTAEPTPALPSGNEPMIDSVAGAIVSAMPLAISVWRQMMSGQYGLVDGQRGPRDEAAGDHEQTGADHELGADAVRRSARSAATRSSCIAANGRKRMPVSNGE